MNLNDHKALQPRKFSTLDFPAAPRARSLNLGFDEVKHCSDLIDTKISFDTQRLNTIVFSSYDIHIIKLFVTVGIMVQ